MPRVLVVDDSPVALHFIRAILSHRPDLEISFASDGAQALAAISRTLPNLVISDLIMPEINGLQLVSALRQSHPLLPVILITGHGSEDIAAEALRVGAASYVPKTVLDKSLLETIQNVLDVYGRTRLDPRLRGTIRRSQMDFELDNDSGLIPVLVRYVQDGIGQLGIIEEAEEMRVSIALLEALTNALYHGNLEINSSLRQADDSAFYGLARERAKLEQYKDRKICLTVLLSPEQVRCVIRDQGPGFDISTVPDPSDAANLERPSGRGIMLMRTFMDEVCYNLRGNEVTMTKRRERIREAG